jgi:tRNA(fMet)-specific endonuclease VapC
VQGSSITLPELRYELAKSARGDTSRTALQRVLDSLNIVSFDAVSAETYGTIRADLEAQGNPIGPLDTLVAAHALSLGLTLVSNNLRGVSRVPRLQMENWVPD